MIINNSSKVIKFNKTKLSPDEISKLYIPEGLEKLDNSITKIDDKYYYYKEVDYEQLINELIGSYLAKLISLDAVDYKIGTTDEKFFALSEVFFKDGYHYKYCFGQFGYNYNHKLTESESIIPRIYLVEDKLLSEVNNPDMLLDLLKLTFLDIKMGQVDRHNENLMVKINKKDGLMNLAPAFDFGSSYVKSPPYPEFYFYDNPLIVLRKNYLSLKSFLNKHPEIYDTVNILVNTNIKDVLDIIQDENRVILSKYEKKYYPKKDKQYSKVLHKII